MMNTAAMNIVRLSIQGSFFYKSPGDHLADHKPLWLIGRHGLFYRALVFASTLLKIVPLFCIKSSLIIATKSILPHHITVSRAKPQQTHKSQSYPSGCSSELLHSMYKTECEHQKGSHKILATTGSHLMTRSNKGTVLRDFIMIGMVRSIAMQNC